ncbi:SDR family NAD(P)-dependent oxidoreductase [Candidatus Poriferisodalis sp.]|uniref:SDR family NAD(P)-dependent oxidoreductase n=1 Tax=Candidatus Poriferisodalis sp. TaxID=3101277 RepID=UPI003AF8E42D
MLDLDLSGRRAIVTGASVGIGAVTVRLLADHGARVAFCSRDERRVADLDGYQPATGEGSVRGYVADMADPGSVDTFLDAAEHDAGPAEILVNNVGASPTRNFLYMSDDDWESPFQLILMSRSGAPADACRR